ncbi:hypothetical protein EDC96DRAFT_585303 [Choanephora cucurbitarum]|nr:hypothetical protein EDC96DRAFT_585303 [Choanephora cucurbitarum]
MSQATQTYLETFNVIVNKEYSNKSNIYDAIRQLGKEHNVIMSIKSSKPTSINYVCKHSGIKRIRSDREDASKNIKSKKMLCGAFVNFRLDALFQKWTAVSHQDYHNHDIPKSPAEYSINRKMPVELEERIFRYFQEGLNAEHVLRQLVADKVLNVTKKDLENLQYRFFSTQRGKMMYEYVIGLQNKGYEVFYTLDSDRRKRFQVIALKAITRKEMNVAVLNLKNLFLDEPDVFPESVKENELERKKSGEKLSYRSIYVHDQDLFEMIRPLFTTVYSFAVNKIFQELLKIRSAEGAIVYQACLCSIRLQHNLTCKHMLSLESSTIPLSIIPRRWRFEPNDNEEGCFEDKIEESEANAVREDEDHIICADKYNVKEAEEEVWEIEDEDDDNCTVIDATGNVPHVIRQSDESASTSAQLLDDARILNVTTKLVELYKLLDSKQDKKNLVDSIEKVLIKTEENRIENALPPKTRTNTKGRPKNVKRNRTHYEYTLEKEDVKEAVLQKKKETIEKTKSRLYNTKAYITDN